MLVSEIVFRIGFTAGFALIAYGWYMAFVKVKAQSKRGIQDFTPAELGYIASRWFPGLALVLLIFVLGEALKHYGL